jgi:hypothetical protein
MKEHHGRPSVARLVRRGRSSSIGMGMPFTSVPQVPASGVCRLAFPDIARLEGADRAKGSKQWGLASILRQKLSEWLSSDHLKDAGRSELVD